MRPYSQAIEKLRGAGLRPTRQRLALAKLLFEGGPRHFTAEMVRTEAHEATVAVSLATVYNTLHQFTQAGLLKEIVVDPARSYFDSTTTEHAHYYHEDTGVLEDIPESINLSDMPSIPTGCKISGIDVVVRLSSQ